MDGPAVSAGRPRLPPPWPRTPRGRYVARMVVFVLVIVSTAMGLASHRTGDLVWLRIGLIVLAGVFLVVTTVDYIGRSRKGF